MARNLKLEWFDELNKLHTSEKHIFRSIFPVLFREPENQKSIADIEQSYKVFENERTSELNSISTTLKAIKSKVVRFKHHTENIEEGDNFIRVLQKIIESIQSEILQFKKWARERYDLLQDENTQITSELSHFENKENIIVDDNFRRAQPYELPIDIEQQRKDLKQWREEKELKRKMDAAKQEQEIILQQLKERDEEKKRQDEIERKKEEVNKWKEIKKQKDDEQAKKLEDEKKKKAYIEAQKLEEYQKKIKQDLNYYKLNKASEDLKITPVQITPTSKGELLRRHRENLQLINEKKKVIDKKKRSNSAYSSRMEKLMLKPSLIQAPKDPQRLIQPTKAWEGRANREDDLEIDEYNRKNQGAHERVVPNRFLAERASGRAIGYDTFGLRVCATPAWMK